MTQQQDFVNKGISGTTKYADPTNEIKRLEAKVENGEYIKVQYRSGWRYEKATNVIDKNSAAFKKSVNRMRYSY